MSMVNQDRLCSAESKFRAMRYFLCFLCFLWADVVWPLASGPCCNACPSRPWWTLSVLGGHYLSMLYCCEEILWPWQLLQGKASSWELLMVFRGFIHNHYGGKQQQHSDTALEKYLAVLLSRLEGSREERYLGLARVCEASKPIPVAHFLQQDYTYPNEVTPPNASQALLLHNDQALKCRSLWRPFLFKPLHSTPWPP